MYFYHAPDDFFGAGLITSPASIIRFSDELYPECLTVRYLHRFPTIHQGEIVHGSVTLTGVISRRVNGVDFKDREVRLITLYCDEDNILRGKIVDREGEWHYLNIQMVTE